MKACLAADGSRHAIFAERFFTSLVQSEQVDIHAVTVCPSSDLHSLGSEIPLQINNLVDECRERSNQVLEGVQSRIGNQVAALTVEILDGHPAHEIIEKVHDFQPDVCVLGSHGWSPTERFLLGSVSDRIAKHVDCSVLITRARENQFEATDCSRILIADDGTESAEKMINRFAELPLRRDMQIHIVSIIQNAIDSGVVLPPQFYEAIEEQQAHANDRLSRYAAKLANVAAEVTFEAKSAMSVPREIVKTAKEQNADLIFLGGKRHSLVERLLLGSVSLNVLHHAPCSVWIDRS